MSDMAHLADSNLSDSVVVISDTEAELTPSKVTPASKRKRDELLKEDNDYKIDLAFDDSNHSSDEFIKMEKMSPEPRRKVPSGPSPQKLTEPDTAISKVPNIVEGVDFDNNLPETVTLLRTENGDKVYLVGTAHFSVESQDDVSKVIRAVQPHFVVLELCNSRTDLITMDEESILQSAQDMNLSKALTILKRSGKIQGLLYITLLHMSAHATRELGMAPGGEFRRAVAEAIQVPGCVVALGDRPINISMSRLLHALTWWQCVKLIWNLVLNKEPIKKEDVENAKKSDFLETMLSEMAGEFPSLKEVLVTERDKYLTYSLQNAVTTRTCQVKGPRRIVGVVGIGHVIGIQKYWNKVTDEEIVKLNEIPPPSVSSRAFRISIRIAVWGGVAYVAYKMAPVAYGGLMKLPYQRLTQIFKP